MPEVELSGMSDAERMQAAMVARQITEQREKLAAEKAEAEASGSKSKSRSNSGSMKALAGLLAATQTQATDNNPALTAVLAAIAESLDADRIDREAERAEKDAKRQEMLDVRARELAAMADTHKQITQQKARTQAVCNHTKERGMGTRIMGQRCSNGHMAYMCNLCFKEYDEFTVPPHLQPSYDAIGLGG